MVPISGRTVDKQRCVSEGLICFVNIESQYIVMQEGTSEGTQIKYKKDGYWYKKDSRGKEGKISAFAGEINVSFG